jgi:hypothetical protein
MNEHKDDPFRDAWQSQIPNEEEKKQMSTLSRSNLEARASKFEQTIKWRNLREFIAAAIAFVGVTFFAITAPRWGMRLGFMELAIATVVITLRIQSHGQNVKRAREASSIESLVSHQATQLTRQIALLHNVWLWYLAPMALGFAIIDVDRFVGLGAKSALTLRTLAPSIAWIVLIAPSIAWMAVMVGVFLLNKRAEKKLQRELAALNESP